MASGGDSGEFRAGDFDAVGIVVFIQFGAHFFAEFGCRCGNNRCARSAAAQRLSSPIDGKERKQTILDLVPIVRARRQVAALAENAGRFLRCKVAQMCGAFTCLSPCH
jgi:hypothetical protein